MKKEKRIRNLLMVFVCLSVFCGALASAAVVKPISVTGTITGDAGSNINWLLDDNPGQAAASLQDEAGNPVTLVTGDTLAKALETYAFRAGGGHTESWTRGTGEGNPEFVFDLGADTKIGTAILWQYGNNGGGEYRNGNSTREFELIFHTEAEGGSIDFSAEAVEFGGIMESIPGLDTIDNFAQVYGFGSRLTARYVGLRIASNYIGQPGIIAGGDRYGLGEVRFATEGYLAPEDFSKALNPEVTQTDGAAPADVDVTLSWDTGLAYDPADANEIIADPSIVKHAIFMSNGSLTDPNLYFVDEIDASGSGASYGPVILPRSRTFYWRIDEVTDTNTVGGDVWSFVTMTADPTIVSGPADQYINAGDTATFGVEAVNPFTDDSSGLSYEWHLVDDSGDTIVGGDSPTYTTPEEQTADNSGDGYYCVVSIVEPDVDASAVTDVAYVVVKQRIAYWPFDGTYENIDDASGLTDGVPVGDPNFAEGLVNAGKALTVDGDDYVSISNDDLAWSPTGSFSVSLWANVNAGSAGHRAAISNRHEPPVQGFILYAQPGDTWGLWTGANVWTGPGNVPGLPGVPFVSGEWIHLVITFDPTGSSGDNLVGTSTLYVNGVKERVLEGDLYRPKALGTSPLFIGAGKNEGPSNYFFNGLIDDVRIYNYAITHEKAATLYTDVVGPACIFGNPAADVTGPEGIPDCAVDYYDFVEFALQWLDHGFFPYRPGVID